MQPQTTKVYIIKQNQLKNRNVFSAFSHFVNMDFQVQWIHWRTEGQAWSYKQGKPNA